MDPAHWGSNGIPVKVTARHSRVPVSLLSWLGLGGRENGTRGTVGTVSCPEGAPVCLMCLGVKSRGCPTTVGGRWRQDSLINIIDSDLASHMRYIWEGPR